MTESMPGMDFSFCPIDYDGFLPDASCVIKISSIEDYTPEGEIPEEFQDPILFTLMKDPVILPSSRITVDRSTIEKHFSSSIENRDPYTNSYLTRDKLIPDVELKARIVEFIRIEQLKKYWSEKPTEMDEDALSTTSTIGYSYSEDEDTKDEDDEDEEHEDEVDSTPTEVNTKIQAQTLGFDFDFSCKVSQWVDSWSTLDEKRSAPLTWIHVYAYFNKDKRYGGYGVVLRNAGGVPIIASAKFSKVGNSFFYQVFEGINAGVALAEKHRRTLLRVQCNSNKVPSLFSNVRHCSKVECAAAPDPNYICKGCTSRIMYHNCEDCDMRLVVPLVARLRCKSLVYLGTSSGMYCMAPHILAKMEKKKILEGGEDGSGEIEPSEFSQRLKTVLWKDSLTMSRG